MSLFCNRKLMWRDLISMYMSRKLNCFNNEIVPNPPFQIHSTFNRAPLTFLIIHLMFLTTTSQQIMSFVCTWLRKFNWKNQEMIFEWSKSHTALESQCVNNCVFLSFPGARFTFTDNQRSLAGDECCIYIQIRTMRAHSFCCWILGQLSHDPKGGVTNKTWDGIVQHDESNMQYKGGDRV